MVSKQRRSNMKAIKQKPIDCDSVEFTRLTYETAKIERMVRTGLWNTPIASDGDRYMAHGDLAQILGIWNGKDWDHNRFRVTGLLTHIYNRAAEIAERCGDTEAHFGRTFRDRKGKRGAGADDEIELLVTRPTKP
jgi:hypothetical protein